MSALVTSRNITEPDETYDLLIAAHDGLTEAESEALNARLILTLINHIGDLDVIRDAILVARSE